MIIKEDKINLKRQREIDVVKALAIVFMITIHLYEECSVSDYFDVLPTKPIDIILQFAGGPLAAPVFMFSLGLGLAYSSHRTPEEFMKRGLKIFLLSYLFNVGRFTIPYIISEGLEFDPMYAVYMTCHIDILPFAGLTFMLTGLLKKLKVSAFGVFVISLVLQGLGTLIAAKVEFNNIISVLVGGLFVKTGEPSYFPLFQWYIYPALGLMFAKYLRHIEDTDKFYKGLFTVSASVLVTLCATLYTFDYDIRNIFALTNDIYYNQSFIYTLFIFACIGIELSIVHLILKYVHIQKVENVISFMSSKLNNIYIVQWFIIGWACFLWLYDDNALSVAETIPAGILVTVISTLLVMAYVKLKKKRQTKKSQ